MEPRISEDGRFRSGFVALVGRPNVGKSTLLNRLLGQKLAATTHKPQTTRKNLLGILNPPDAQIAFLDTPGHHRAKGPLNRFMVSQAEDAIRQADAIGFVVEARAHGDISPGNLRILELLKTVGKPIVVLVNKTDRVKEKSGLLFQIQAYADALSERARAVVPISARRSEGLERAVIELGRVLPEGPALFDEDDVTDQSERAIVSEFIREKVMLELQDELPYAAAVTVEDFEDERPRLVRVIATIHVERQPQKGIVIGRGGERLRSIGIRARQELESFLGSQVYLDLTVKVSRDWSNNVQRLAHLGYADEEEGGVGVGGVFHDLLAELGHAEDDEDREDRP